MKIFVTLTSIILWGSAVYHIFIGVISLFSMSWIRGATKAFYNLNIPEDLDPRFEYACKPMGAFAIFTALISYEGAVQGRPDRNFIVLSLALLFMLRAILRWCYFPLFHRAFGVVKSRNYFHIGFNFFLTAIMLASLLS